MIYLCCIYDILLKFLTIYLLFFIALCRHVLFVDVVDFYFLQFHLIILIYLILLRTVTESFCHMAWLCSYSLGHAVIGKHDNAWLPWSCVSGLDQSQVVFRKRCPFLLKYMSGVVFMAWEE